MSEFTNLYVLNLRGNINRNSREKEGISSAPAVELELRFPFLLKTLKRLNMDGFFITI